MRGAQGFGTTLSIVLLARNVSRFSKGQQSRIQYIEVKLNRNAEMIVSEIIEEKRERSK